MELTVALKDNSYPIYIKKGILNNVNKYIKNIYQGNKIMIISDDQVYSYYGERLTNVLKKEYVVDHVIVPHGEQSKRFDILPSLYKSLLEFKLTRTDLIIALGGGVIGDVFEVFAGFAIFFAIWAFEVEEAVWPADFVGLLIGV